MSKLEMNMKRVGYLIIILGAITASIVFWGTYGWITRAAYAIDEQAKVEIHKGHATQTAIKDLTTLIETVITNQKINRDEWVCDELDEEIPDLRKDVLDTFDQDEKIDIERTIEVKNKLWDSVDCNRFTH